MDVLLTSKSNLGVLTTSTSQTPTSTSITNSTVSTTKAPSETGTTSTQQLGTGSIVGIAIGGAAFLALVALLILYLRKKHNRGKKTKNVAYSNIANSSENPTLEAMSYQGYAKKSPSTLNTFPSPNSDTRGYSWQGSTRYDGSHFGYDDTSSGFPMGQLQPVEMVSKLIDGEMRLTNNYH